MRIRTALFLLCTSLCQDALRAGRAAGKGSCEQACHCTQISTGQARLRDQDVGTLFRRNVRRRADRQSSRFDRRHLGHGTRRGTLELGCRFRHHEERVDRDQFARDRRSAAHCCDDGGRAAIRRHGSLRHRPGDGSCRDSRRGQGPQTARTRGTPTRSSRGKTSLPSAILAAWSTAWSAASSPASGRSTASP